MATITGATTGPTPDIIITGAIMGAWLRLWPGCWARRGTIMVVATGAVLLGCWVAQSHMVTTAIMGIMDIMDITRITATMAVGKWEGQQGLLFL